MLRPWLTTRRPLWTLLRTLIAYSAEPRVDMDLKDIFTGRREVMMAQSKEMTEHARTILPDPEGQLC